MQPPDLKRDAAAKAHGLGTDLDEFLQQSGGASRRSPAVAQVVGQGVLP